MIFGIFSPLFEPAQNYNSSIGKSQTAICDFRVLPDFTYVLFLFAIFVRVFLCITCGKQCVSLFSFAQAVDISVDNTFQTSVFLWTLVCVHGRNSALFVVTLVCFCGYFLIHSRFTGDIHITHVDMLCLFPIVHLSGFFLFSFYPCHAAL